MQGNGETLNALPKNFKEKKILITGGLGFIGSNLAHYCVELGANVTIYDNLDPKTGGNLYNINDIRDKVDLRYHDILDYDRLVECVAGKEIVFNCAASTSHPFSMREPWLDLDANSRGTINLLEALRRFNADAKLIHLGTSTQLGTLQYRPADENHPEFPMDIYSANKCVSEKYVLIYAHAYAMHATVIRLSNVYGPRASIHSPEFTFNNYFIGLALQGKEIRVFGDGQQKRNVIFVEDAVKALVMAAESTECDGETYFAVGDKHYSIAQIADLTVRIMGKGCVVFVDWPRERKSTEIGDAILSNQKIRNRLNWAPGVDLQKGLTITREYYLECLEKYIK